MNTLNRYTIVLISIWLSLAAVASGLAATIPAGTELVVRTVDPISSHSRVGRKFKAQLAQEVRVRGSTLLMAGTPASGKVEGAIGDFRKSDALTVNLTDISVNGRNVPIKTTGAQEMHSTMRKTKRGVEVYNRDFIFHPNTIITFRLAQPVVL
jgi:hypothetical protein